MDNLKNSIDIILSEQNDDRVDIIVKLSELKKRLGELKLYADVSILEKVTEWLQELIAERKSIYDIIVKYYPQDKTCVDIQSALTYLLDERVEEIQNLAIKCDILENQIELFKNKEK